MYSRASRKNGHGKAKLPEFVFPYPLLAIGPLVPTVLVGRLKNTHLIKWNGTAVHIDRIERCMSMFDKSVLSILDERDPLESPIIISVVKLGLQMSNLHHRSTKHQLLFQFEIGRGFGSVSTLMSSSGGSSSSSYYTDTNRLQIISSTPLQHLPLLHHAAASSFRVLQATTHLISLVSTPSARCQVVPQE